MVKRLLLLLVALPCIETGKAQQASVLGNCFYDNVNQRVIVRIAFRNNTSSATNFELAAIRFAYQYNAAVLTYDGFHSFLYNGTDQNSGLNDASYLNNNFNPETRQSDGTRNATIATGGTKVMTQEYINRSTLHCTNVWVVPPNTYRVAFDIYFKFKPGYTPAMYNLNTPGFGFGTPNFIAQFLTSHAGNLSDANKEIAVVFIINGQNPEQPFDMNNCNNGQVNPVSISSANINFISPITGVLAGRLEQEQLFRTSAGARLEWTACNNELMDAFEIQRKSGNGDFATIGTVPGTLQAGTCTYSFTDAAPPASGVPVFYRIVARSTDGTVLKGMVLRMQTAAATRPLRLYPNPTTGVLYVDVPVQAGEYMYRILDAAGKQVFTLRSAARRPELQLAHLPPGLYQLEATHLLTAERTLQSFIRQ
ncbi:MAG: T9SS type A sorting domain-containing protein [Lacibacter sp.]